MTHFVEVREKTANVRPTRARAKEAKVERGVKSSKGGQSKSNDKSTFNRQGCPSETAPRVSNPVSIVCGEEGHWEEDCPQADVDMH